MKWSSRSLGTLLLFLLAWTAPALHAESTVLSGDFDGSEAEAASFFGYCPGATLAYQVHQIQVTQSGDYQVYAWGTTAGSPGWASQANFGRLRKASLMPLFQASRTAIRYLSSASKRQRQPNTRLSFL